MLCEQDFRREVSKRYSIVAIGCIVYEFLQLEPRGKYHQPAEFIGYIKQDFCENFEREVTNSMRLVEEEE